MERKRKLLHFLEMTGGILIFSSGTVLGIIAGLGQTTSTGTSSAIARIWGIPVGTAMFFLYAMFLMLQLVILKMDFRWTALFQLIPAGMHAVFMNYFRYRFFLFQRIAPDTYFERFLIFIVGMLFISFGFTVIKCSDFLNFPPESFCSIVSKKRHIRFGTCKMMLDIVYVTVSLSLCTLFQTKPDMVREGTLIFAVMNGCLINWYMPFVEEIFQKLEDCAK